MKGETMSIILKGIDMPRNAHCHHIIIYDNGNTYMTTSNVLYETDRKDVEAIQIPRGHGKIVDIDDLVVKYWDGNYMEIDNEAYDNAPTILEAEE